jgi:predicted ArsR family transcriptional regulator
MDICAGKSPAFYGRPSSLQRCERMRALLGELAKGEMDGAAIAAFLGCSNSSAYKYVTELVDADLVFPSNLPSGQGRPKLGYCLTEDMRAVDDFISGLLAVHAGATLQRKPKRSGQVRTTGSQHFHIMADDQSDEVQATSVSVRRDPLVIALFGPQSRC